MKTKIYFKKMKSLDSTLLYGTCSLSSSTGTSVSTVLNNVYLPILLASSSNDQENGTIDHKKILMNHNTRHHTVREFCCNVGRNIQQMEAFLHSILVFPENYYVDISHFHYPHGNGHEVVPVTSTNQQHRIVGREISSCL